jgi:hypothetical protein
MDRAAGFDPTSKYHGASLCGPIKHYTSREIEARHGD